MLYKASFIQITLLNLILHIIISSKVYAWCLEFKGFFTWLSLITPPPPQPVSPRTRYLAKENITAFPNHTVSYLLPAGAIFDPSMSVGPEEDMVTTLNLAVAVSGSTVLSGMGWVFSIACL